MKISVTTRRLLQVMYLQKIGPSGIRKIMDMAREEEYCDVIFKDDALLLEDFGKRQKKGNAKYNWKKIIDDCEKENIDIYSPYDIEYPKILSNINEFPPIIYVKGNKDILKGVKCAVIGTQRPSDLGKICSERIANILADNNIGVVNGAAIGIDDSAIDKILNKKKYITAVLAHGLDTYINENRQNKIRQILDGNGLLISEHPPGVPPERREFERCTRIQTGLSVATVVIESSHESFSISAASHARAQGRRLFCVSPAKNVKGADKFDYGGADRLAKEMGASVWTTKDPLLKIISNKIFEDDWKDFNILKYEIRKM